MKNRDFVESNGEVAGGAIEGLIAKRSDGLIVQVVGSEVLVHDAETQTCHLLSEQSAALWEQLESPSTLADLKTGFAERFPDLGVEGDEFVEVTLADLVSKNLLQTNNVLGAPSPERRALLKAAGFVLVASALAPRPAAAGSMLTISNAVYWSQSNGSVPRPNGKPNGNLPTAGGGTVLCGSTAGGFCGGTPITVALQQAADQGGTNSISVMCDNTTFGDPCPGVFKECTFDFTCPGRATVINERVCENSLITITCP